MFHNPSFIQMGGWGHQGPRRWVTCGTLESLCQISFANIISVISVLVIVNMSTLKKKTVFLFPKIHPTNLGGGGSLGNPAVGSRPWCEILDQMALGWWMCFFLCLIFVYFFPKYQYVYFVWWWWWWWLLLLLLLLLLFWWWWVLYQCSKSLKSLVKSCCFCSKNDCCHQLCWLCQVEYSPKWLKEQEALAEKANLMMAGVSFETMVTMVVWFQLQDVGRYGGTEPQWKRVYIYIYK